MNDGITLYSLMRIHVNDFQTSHLTTVNVCAYINKFVFEKILLRIKKIVKFFSKNGILLCILRTHVNKIQFIITNKYQKKKKKTHLIIFNICVNFFSKRKRSYEGHPHYVAKKILDGNQFDLNKKHDCC